MFCINCGKQLPDNSRFCPYCGTPVAVTEIGEAAEEKTEELKAAAEETAEELKVAAEETAEELKAAAEEKAAEVSEELKAAAEKAAAAAAGAKEAAERAAEKAEEEIAETFGELSGIAEEKAEELEGLSNETIEDLAEKIEEGVQNISETAGEVSAEAEDKIEELEAAAEEKLEAANEAAEATAEAVSEAAETAAEAIVEALAEATSDWSLTKEAAAAAEAEGMAPEEAAKVEATESAKAAAETAAAAAAAAAASEAAKAEKKKSKSKKIISTVLALLVVAGAAGWYFYQNSAPVKLKKLQANVEQIAATGDYEQAIDTYKEALGTGLDDAVIEQGIKDLYINYLNAVAQTEPLSVVMDLTDRIAEEFPDLSDSALAMLRGVLEREMEAARDAGDIDAAKDIYMKAILKYPTISGSIESIYSGMRKDKAEELFSDFMTEECVAILKSGSLQDIRDYLELRNVRAALNEITSYNSGDVVIDAAGYPGLKVGKHRVDGTTVIYIGEYKGNVPDGQGVRICYVIDSEAGADKYIVTRLSSTFYAGVPSGKFSERVLVNGTNRHEYLVTGSTNSGKYNGPIKIEYSSADEPLVFMGNFTDGKLTNAETTEDGKYFVAITEDGSVYVTTTSLDSTWGVYPGNRRIL
ncbi:MAG: zinc ribbon domain-containing protein [Firmicutes bacterium]|nr:zinc ribbon domain-containing protein [Bacillota bacterium]